MNRPARARPFVLAGRTVRNICPAATLPTNPHPLVEFVKINMAREQQQPCCDEFLTSPHAASEPRASDDSGAFGAEVIPALSHLAEMIDQRLQFGLSRG